MNKIEFTDLIKKNTDTKKRKKLIEKLIIALSYEEALCQLKLLVNEEDDTIQIFLALALASLCQKTNCNLEEIIDSLYNIANNSSKKVVTYGLIPSFVVFQQEAESYFIMLAERNNYYENNPVLQRAFLQARAKFLTIENNSIKVQEFLDLLEQLINTYEPEVQQGLISAINIIGQKNLEIIGKWLYQQINKKDVLIFNITEGVLEKKLGDKIGSDVKDTINSKIIYARQQRIQDINSKFNSDSLKESVTYQEVVVSSILHYLYVPMLPFSWGINPYRGCFHACEYCYGRGSHEYLGHTVQDFERIIYIKINACEVLRNSLASRKWQKEKSKLVNIGTVTDPYQPIEKEYQITRKILEVMHEYHNPVTITTKSGLVSRDADILSQMGRLTEVVFSIPSLDQDFLDKIEKRASPVSERLEAIKELKKNNVSVSVLLIPIFPYINDDLDCIEQTVKVFADYGVDYVIPDILNLRGESRARVESFLTVYYPTLKEKYKHLYVRGKENIYVDSDYQKQLFNFLMKDCLPKYKLNDYSKMVKGKW